MELKDTGLLKINVEIGKRGLKIRLWKLLVVYTTSDSIFARGSQWKLQLDKIDIMSIDNRRKSPSISKKQKKTIEEVAENLWQFVIRDFPGPSKVDVRNLAYAYVLGVYVVTDDTDMTKLAAEFEIQTITTLELLKLMLEHDHITYTEIVRIAAYWSYEEDKPKNFRQEFRRLFGKDPPD